MSDSPVIRAASPLVLAAGLLAAAHAGAPVEVFPVLGVVRGPLGLALLAVAAGLTVARATEVGGWRPPEIRWPGARALFLAGSVLFVGSGLFYASRLRASGDEPHYLLMAQSLWREHDLDLADNFAREDYLEYTPGPLRPHYGEPRRDGRPYPAHSPGLPILLAPVYALGGRPGCVLLLGLLGALVAARTAALARRWGGSGAAGLWAWAAALGAPLLFYSFHVYTEAPSALLILCSLEILLGTPGVLGAAGAALLASALPWLHVKMLPVAAALAVIAGARLRGRSLAAFALVAGVAAGLYVGHYQIVFGRPTPLAIYGGVPADLSGSPMRALAGLLLDRSFGLLPAAPLFLLALPGLAALTVRWRTTWPGLLVAVAVLAPVLMWRMWWGGQCPPGRFLVPLLPILAAGVGLVAGAEPRGLAHWRLPMLAVGGALCVFAIHDPGALLLLNRANRPTRLWAALSGDVPVGRYLPSLTIADAVETRVAAVWMVALALVLALHFLARRHDDVDRLFRGLLIPLVLFLAIGAGVDGWARTKATAVEPVGPTAVQGPDEEPVSVR